mmetsp:Transcript_21609/g.26517  ORF Transcript_21609/g.26517 Transcript_21609/m.26517 type:complete len:455 (+) Transcript_21609:94-1458(+)
MRNRTNMKYCIIALSATRLFKASALQRSSLRFSHPEASVKDLPFSDRASGSGDSVELISLDEAFYEDDLYDDDAFSNDENGPLSNNINDVLLHRELSSGSGSSSSSSSDSEDWYTKKYGYNANSYNGYSYNNNNNNNAYSNNNNYGYSKYGYNDDLYNSSSTSYSYSSSNSKENPFTSGAAITCYVLLACGLVVVGVLFASEIFERTFIKKATGRQGRKKTTRPSSRNKRSSKRMESFDQQSTFDGSIEDEYMSIDDRPVIKPTSNKSMRTSSRSRSRSRRPSHYDHDESIESTIDTGYEEINEPRAKTPMRSRSQSRTRGQSLSRQSQSNIETFKRGPEYYPPPHGHLGGRTGVPPPYYQGGSGRYHGGEQYYPNAAPHTPPIGEQYYRDGRGLAPGSAGGRYYPGQPPQQYSPNNGEPFYAGVEGQLSQFSINVDGQDQIHSGNADRPYYRR